MAQRNQNYEIKRLNYDMYDTLQYGLANVVPSWSLRPLELLMEKKYVLSITLQTTKTSIQVTINQ